MERLSEIYQQNGKTPYNNRKMLYLIRIDIKNAFNSLQWSDIIKQLQYQLNSDWSILLGFANSRSSLIYTWWWTPDILISLQCKLLTHLSTSSFLFSIANLYFLTYLPIGPRRSRGEAKRIISLSRNYSILAFHDIRQLHSET